MSDFISNELSLKIDNKKNLGSLYFDFVNNTGVSSNRIRIRYGRGAATFFVMSMDRRENGITVCACVQIYNGSLGVSPMTNGFSGTFSASVDAYGIIVTLPNTAQEVVIFGTESFTIDVV